MNLKRKKDSKYVRRYPKVERKHGEILGIKVSITSKPEVLEFVRSRLESKDKFYIVTPNPENLLLATGDWSLEEAIRKSDLSVPDGIGLAMAYKFLNLIGYKDEQFRFLRLLYNGLKIGLSVFTNKSSLTNGFEVIKGRELFLDILKILNERKAKVYLFGGEYGEHEQAVDNLKIKFPNITFQTNHKFPMFNRSAIPVSEEDRKMHKVILGSIKLFEPDMVFVALNTPKQEKWIYKNLYRLPGVTGAMTVGGTYNYVAGNMKVPPDWLASLGLEWVYRLMQEPKRLKRIINAVVVFPWKVFNWKLKH